MLKINQQEKEQLTNLFNNYSNLSDVSKAYIVGLTKGLALGIRADNGGMNKEKILELVGE